MEKILPSLKKPIIKISLTRREKNLLLLLIAVIILWVSTRFIIKPQLDKINALDEEKIELESIVSQINALISKEDSIQEELVSLRGKESKISKSFFSSLDQYAIIALLDEILKDDGFVAEDMIFYEPTEESFGDISLMRMDVDIPYTGDYNGTLRVIKGISTYPKEIMINSITMDTVDDKITGSISLSFYGLSQEDDSSGEKSNFIGLTEQGSKDPFITSEEYTEEVTVEDLPVEVMLVEDLEESPVEEESELEEDMYVKEPLEDFEEGVFDFIPSNLYVKGNVFKSKVAIDEGTSLRFEYYIVALGDKNRASVDLASRDISIKYPPYSIGIWVYSYGYSPSTLGLKLKSQNNKEVDILLSEGISWIGWKYLEGDLPLDLSLYPLNVDKIYVELTDFRDDAGVILFDKLEVNYPKESNSLGHFFEYHLVKDGESLEDISMKYYGTKDKKSLIKEYNELQSDTIKAGRILVIPR